MNTKKGFTLVELLVVIAILAILATVSVVGYTSFIDRAEQSNADTEAHQIETMITSALVIPNDGVKITVDGSSVILSNVDNKITVVTSVTGKTQDLTSEVAGLKGALTFVANGSNFDLVYTAENGKTCVVLSSVAGVTAAGE